MNIDDLILYKQLLQFTGARLRVDSRLKGLKNSKYTNIIRPLFRSNEHTGKGYYKNFITNQKTSRVTGISLKKPQIEYWNDLDELVERLQLLHVSRQCFSKQFRRNKN